MGFALITTSPTGARFVSMTVPGGNNLAAECFKPASDICRAVLETNNLPFMLFISLGVSQAISPSQNSSFLVDGVAPVSTLAMYFFSGSGLSNVRVQFLG